MLRLRRTPGRESGPSHAAHEQQQQSAYYSLHVRVFGLSFLVAYVVGALIQRWWAMTSQQATVSRPSEYQSAHQYVEGAGGSDIVHSFPGTLAARLIMSMDTVGLMVGGSMKIVAVVAALSWLLYRAYQVVNKPLDELAGLLGFDLPAAPSVDLAGITADGAVLLWKQPEKVKNIKEYEIHINGRLVGTVLPSETSVKIAGLRPGSFYIIRVAVFNHLDFSSRSPPLRIRTKDAISGDFFGSAAADGHDTDGETVGESVPHVRLYRVLRKRVPPSPVSQPMTREHSTGLGPKRNITGRRPSPGALGLGTQHSSMEDFHESAYQDASIQQLTEKLDGLRRDIGEAGKQAQEEEQDEARHKDELTKERDELRAAGRKKELASRELKREVSALERNNTATQNERMKHERLLQLKKSERQKLKHDAVRWEREARDMRLDVERIAGEKENYREKAATDLEALRQRQAEETAAMKTLEDENKSRNAAIKSLERGKNNSPNSNEASAPDQDIVQRQQHEAEDDRQWDNTLVQLQAQYHMAAQNLERMRKGHDEQVQFLEGVRLARRRQIDTTQYVSSPTMQERMPRRDDSQRSRRTASGHTHTTAGAPSPSVNGGFVGMSHGSFGANMTNVNPTFPTVSMPYLNIHNGMTIAASEEGSGMTEEERDRLSGGGPVSPGAGAELLPSNLLTGDEDSRSSREGDGPDAHNENDSDRQSSIGANQPLVGLGALPGLGRIPGLGSEPIPGHPPAYPTPGPQSPGSVSSRSPSMFASPQASAHNLHLGSPEGLPAFDSDRRSVRSNQSNRAASGGGSRFSQLFGRGKTVSADEGGPALGKVQSHSVPRQDQGLVGFDSISNRKRNSSLSAFTFGGVLNRADKPAADDVAPVQQKNVLTRRRPFNLFSQIKAADGWSSDLPGLGSEGIRSASPRPGSTHSTELPRPSQDSTRWGPNWGSADAASLNRGSPLSGSNWGLPQNQSRLWPSRHPSRRPSVQHAVSGPPDDIMEDEDSDALPSDNSRNLAPIGTKPSKSDSKRPVTPKLNPAAKDFKSFFGLKKDKDMQGGSSKATTPHASAASTPNMNAMTGAADDDSPPNRRKSRDTRSVTTAESSLLQSESSRNSLDRTPSYSNSDAPTPPSLSVSTGKESFMQKLTRKSSSGKFTLPSFKREKSRMNASATDAGSSTPTGLVAEDDEDALSASVNSLDGGPRDGTARLSKEAIRANGRSWGSVLTGKLGKKKASGETPSVSGMSVASETGDDEEEQ